MSFGKTCRICLELQKIDVVPFIRAHRHFTFRIRPFSSNLMNSGCYKSRKAFSLDQDLLSYFCHLLKI